MRAAAAGSITARPPKDLDPFVGPFAYYYSGTRAATTRSAREPAFLLSSLKHCCRFRSWRARPEDALVSPAVVSVVLVYETFLSSQSVCSAPLGYKIKTKTQQQQWMVLLLGIGFAFAPPLGNTKGVYSEIARDVWQPEYPAFFHPFRAVAQTPRCQKNSKPRSWLKPPLYLPRYIPLQMPRGCTAKKVDCWTIVGD